jgi:hypothetical protein
MQRERGTRIRENRCEMTKLASGEASLVISYGKGGGAYVPRIF